jgi:hypothetical protein
MMLFILGAISFLQMTLIPGFIIALYSKLNIESKLQAVVYVFGFSLISNYIVVYVLTMFEIYTPLTMYILLAIEAALLVYYRVRSGKTGFQIDMKSMYDSLKGFFQSNGFL